MKNIEQFKADMYQAFDPYLSRLGKLKPDFVGYRDFHKDGSSITYCSNNLWYTCAVSREDLSSHYANELLLLKRDHCQIIIRSPNIINTKLLRELRSIDMCNSIIVYRIMPNFIHMFCFIFKASNLTTLNYFVNKRELFENVAEQCLSIGHNISRRPSYYYLREQIFSNPVSKNIFNIRDDQTGILTYKQYLYVEFLKQGATDKDIACQLGVCPKTVEYHLRNIRSILGCHSRFDIVQYANQKFM